MSAIRLVSTLALGLLAGLACSDDSSDSGGGPAPDPVVYENDFTTTAGTEWSGGAITTAPGGEKYLGDFENESAVLSLTGLHAHTEAVVEVDFYALQSWDGNGLLSPGPDIATFELDGATLLTTTFMNTTVVGDRQAYPDAFPGGDHPAFTGALVHGSLGFFQDATYRLTFTVAHSASDLVFEVSGSGLQGAPDEFWGIDNVRVTLD